MDYSRFQTKNVYIYFFSSYWIIKIRYVKITAISSPLCLPDLDDLEIDLTKISGLTAGWGATDIDYQPTTCDWTKGETDPDSVSDYLKKISVRLVDSKNNGSLIMIRYSVSSPWKTVTTYLMNCIHHTASHQNLIPLNTFISVQTLPLETSARETVGGLLLS